MTTDPTTETDPTSADTGGLPDNQFTTAYAVVCPDAGLYCEGTRNGATWRLPVIAFDNVGRPLVANIGATTGRLLPAAVFDPAYRLLSRAQVVAGSEAPVEYTDAQGVRRLGTVSAWGIDLDGTVQPLHVTDRPGTSRRVERDQRGNIVGTVEE